MIGILGPTGQVGRHLLPTLERAGAPLRALAHSHESALALKGDHIDVVTGDMRDPEVLAQFLDGVSTLFLLTPASPDQIEVQNRIVDAAVAAKVGAIVKFSVCTAAEDSLDCFSRWHFANDVYLENSGVPYTILYPHTFMQTIALQFAPSVRTSSTMTAIPRPDATIAMVDARDAADVAAAVLLNGEHRGEKILITGPEALSYRDCAERIGAVLGRDVSYEQISPEQAYQQFEAAGFPDWLCGGLIGLQQKYDTEALNQLSDAVPQLTGKPARAFTDFLSAHGDLFA